MVTREDGRVDAFVKDLSGAWTADPDVTIRLSAVAGGTGSQTGWSVVRDDDSTEAYTLDGRLSSITTRAGLVTTLSYDASNRLAKVTGPFGHTLSFASDPGNHVSSITLPDGQTIVYGYDIKNNLASVTYPGGVSRKYVYENTTLPHALTGIVDENGGRFSTYAYDSQGRAVSTRHAGGADLTTFNYNGDGSVNVIDADNNLHTYYFTTLFNLVKPVSIDQTSCACGSAGYSYDPNTGFLIGRTDFNGNITTYTRDQRGLELSLTEAVGTAQARTITTTWHPVYHLPLSITEPRRAITFSYDARGNLLKKSLSSGASSTTWTYTYSAKGQVLTAQDPLGHSTGFTYDAKGDLAAITDALGHVTRITMYNADGLPLVIQDPNGFVTTLVYDARGRPTSRVVGTEVTGYTYGKGGGPIRVTFPDKSYLAYSYDAAHRLTGITDALGDRIVYTLDPVGNLLTEQVFDPSNHLAKTRSYAYDKLNRVAREIGALGQTTIYGYDNDGNLTSVADPLGNKTSNAYDALNRLVQATDPNNGVTRYGYDSSDRMTSVTDPRNLTTSYAYDALGDLTAVVSPDTGMTLNSYDAAGNMISSTDARGKKTNYAYDALNRRTKVTFADGKAVSYTYDQGLNEIGRLSAMSDPSGTTAWSFDQYGRVTQKTQKTGKISLTTKTAYDSGGRVAAITYPSGRKLTYSYDAKSGRLAGIQAEGKTLVYNAAYQPFGPVDIWVMGNGLAYLRGFDQDGRISELTFGQTPGDVLTLAYDAAGRITGITETLANSKTFGYDALDRLTNYASGTTTQIYNYDADGNRIKLTTDTGTFNYAYSPANNRLTGVTGPAPQTNTYDAAGNLTGDGTHTYTYDARGRLSQASTGPAQTQYSINGFGRRTVKSGASVSTGTEYFVYDEAGRLIGEYDAAGDPIQETVWLGDLPVGVLKPGGALYYVNPNHLGAPLSIVDQSGKAVWTWNPDPFGNGLPNQQPAGGTAFVYNLRFPGQYYDSETGLYYNMARDYSPPIGRYIQSDPIGLKGGINPYVYAAGDPVGRVDPNGLQECDDAH
jgi:RHS repeat-associated protein